MFRIATTTTRCELGQGSINRRVSVLRGVNLEQREALASITRVVSALLPFRSFVNRPGH